MRRNARSLCVDSITAVAVVLCVPMTSSAQSGSASAQAQGQVQLKGPGLSADQVRIVRTASLRKGPPRDVAKLRQAIARAKRLRAGGSKAGATISPQDDLELAGCYEEMTELSRSSLRELDDDIEGARGAKQTRRLKALLKQRDQRQQELASWREETVKQLAVVARDHPNLNHRDEVLYRLAFAIEEQADDDRHATELQNQQTPSPRESQLRQRARQVYHQLIKSYPNSVFIPHAFLSFGDYYFNEGAMDNALAFYERVAQFPSSDAHGYVLYRLAWCQIHLHDDREAVSRFVSVIQYTMTNPQACLSSELGRLAKREIVEPYARSFPATRAWAFFSRIGGNDAVLMMESLGERYIAGAQWTEARDVYQQLIRENQGSTRAAFYRTRLAECEQHIRP